MQHGYYRLTKLLLLQKQNWFKSIYQISLVFKYPTVLVNFHISLYYFQIRPAKEDKFL
jgi:hypothetical protein